MPQPPPRPQATLALALLATVAALLLSAVVGHAAPTPTGTGALTDPGEAVPSGSATGPDAGILAGGYAWTLPAAIGLAIGVGIGLALVRYNARSEEGPGNEDAGEPVIFQELSPRSTPPEEAAQRGAPVTGGQRACQVAPAAEAGSSPSLPDMLRRGQQAVDEERYEDAIGWFDRVIAQHEQAPAPHFCRALCLTELDRHDEALTGFQRAQALDPTDPLARFHHARTLARLGESQQAISTLAPMAMDLEELATTILEDPAFACLHDHPRLLALLGKL